MPTLATPPDDRVLSTLEADGSRHWIEPRLSRGPWLTARRVLAYFLIAIFLAIPFLKMNGKPLVLLDIAHRQFTLFGYTFLPTDTILLAFLGLSIFVTIFLVTAIFGRVWCGWACPQTVYLEFVYRPLERLFYGTAGRGGRPSRPVALWRKIGYFLAALLISILPAHAFLSYFVGVDNLAQWVTRSPFEHPVSFTVMLATTLLMLFNFYYFREQLCILACPYGRFQSVLLDRQSLIVAYDRQRGEPRGRLAAAAPAAAPRGDCVDCGLCVVTCPTGIDIRKGLQMECLHCTQCMDACDAVMDKVAKPRGLIRYSSQAAIDGQPARFLRPRVIIYPLLLAALVTGLVTLLVRKPTTDVAVLRNFGNPFVLLPTGEVSNSLRLKLTNRTREDRSYRVDVVGAVPARLVVAEQPLVVPGGESRTDSVLISVPPSAFTGGVCDVTLRLSDGQGFTRDVTCRLLGPTGPVPSPATQGAIP